MQYQERQTPPYQQYQTMKVAVPPGMGPGQQILKSKQQMDY